MPMPGVATRETKRQQEPTCQLSEPEGINTCITAPAGCIALALVFLRTNCEAVASRVAIPQNLFQLEQLRPDFAMLRIVAKNLILWDQIEPTEAWLERQVPAFLLALNEENATDDLDWLLVGQTKANLAAGGCLALGLRFAGSSNKAAKQLLIARLLAFRDAKRSDAHPALMASRPAPDDLDVITLETCQSTVAMALGMVMAGTGDLDALRTLRSLRKKTSLDTGYGVHMATHMAIGWVCLGGGRYTFNQEPLSIAALLMAAFPRLPMGLVDNRCHLQAFRHLYALAARHHCIEAVEVDSKQPAHVHVTLETETGTDLETETLRFPRLLLAGKEVRSISINSEGFWPVTIQRAESGTPAARWMKAVDETRRLYVKRCGPERPDSRLESQAWFPTFTAPDANHVERLTMAKLAFGAPGEGPNEPGVVSAAEWAAAFCCPTPPPLPPGTCLADFDGPDSTLVERFARILDEGRSDDPKKPLRSQLPCTALLAQKLHECVMESKLAVFPWFVLLYLQMQDKEARGPVYTPVSACCSSLAADQLMGALGFQEIRDGIGARHEPLLPQDFLAERKAELRKSRFHPGAGILNEL
ncbi:Anaphase-promoting complex subunit 1 (Cyclosome subunit 1) (Protein EMBRYO DEFECTIVE 2771), partial [Durusdinium trenchii]